jgi:hypothetical protein
VRLASPGSVSGSWAVPAWTMRIAVVIGTDD